MVALPSWLSFGRKDQINISLRDLLSSIGISSKTGVNVNWQTALQAVTAMACARIIAEGIAQVPLKLHRDRADGGSDIMKGEKLYKLVNSEPNEFNTSYEWRETMGLHLVFSGNAYSIIVRVAGEPVELLPLNPRDVTVIKEGVSIRYEVRIEGKQNLKVASEDMLHIRGISWDGAVGLDGVKLAADAIGLAIATEEHGARQFSNGAQPNGMLSTDANLTDPLVRKALRESWDEVHRGLANVGKTAVMWGGLKWQSTAQQNDQAQFLETRNFQVEEVCRWAHVMPIMVGHASKATTFASASEMFLAHVVHTLGPWYARIEQALDKQLLSKSKKDQDYYFKFNVSALMRGSHADRSNYFSKALGAGGSPAWMTQDEVRSLDELNPMGGEASKLPVATNVPQPPATPPVDPNAKAIGLLESEVKNMAMALQSALNKQAPAAPINVDARTTVNMPEQKQGDVNVNVESPDVNVQAGDVHVAQPDVNVNVAHPSTSTRTVKRDDKMEIEEIVTKHEF